nr:hypothetical protein [Nodosilinea sp. LEGE 06152]
MLGGRGAVDPIAYRDGLASAGVERALDIEGSGFAKHQTVGVDQKQIGCAINPQGAKNRRGVAPGNTAEN